MVKSGEILLLLFNNDKNSLSEYKNSAAVGLS